MSESSASLSRATATGNTVRFRVTELVMLMADLYAGQDVHSARIKDLLTPGEWRRFKLRMHGPSLPVMPSAGTLDCLYAYRKRLKFADVQHRTANARKRNKTMIGPDLFRQVEAAYAAALETLGETLCDHPHIAHYLSPHPDFSDWRITPTQCGVPRLSNFIAEAPARVYSRKTGEEYVLTAIEILRDIARRELQRLKRNKAAGGAPAPK